MGAGHDGAARALAEQLTAAGHVAEVRDFLRSGPLRIGSALRRGYEFELRHVPSAYDATYRFWYRVPWLCPFIAWLVTILTRRRVMRWVDDMDPWVVVSTYPLSTLCLGRLRSTGRLAVPAVNFITDFGVHPLWVQRHVDVNLAIHALPAEVAERRTGRRSVFTGPAVSGRFDPALLPERDAARARFGIRPDERAVLIVAGSWGVGNLGATWSAVAADGRFTPVVVCGRDERLLREVEALTAQGPGRSIVLGWTDDMPALMVACDVLVENAGGLTSLEAMRVGLPVVSFDPIAGHGVENTTAMDAVGVGRLARDGDALRNSLSVLSRPGPERAMQVARASGMFRVPPCEAVLDAARLPVGPPSVVRRGAGLAARTAMGAVAVAAFAWGGMTTGVAMATDAGAGVARPVKLGVPVAYVGVRLSAGELGDPTIAETIRRMGITAVVDDVTAEAASGQVRALAAQGVDVVSGGLGRTPGAGDPDLPWEQAAGDARAGRRISELIDAPVTQTLAGRRLNAWDLIDCGRTHTTLVVPNHILHVGSAPVPIRIAAREIYLVDGLSATPAQLRTFLARLQSSLKASQLIAEPLAALG
jgi:processive 1,2-diacylglycerol beta-glucosyltransferase